MCKVVLISACIITTLQPRLYIPWHRREKSRYALLMTANMPENSTVHTLAPTFSLLLVSHGGISLCTYVCVFYIYRRNKLCMYMFVCLHVCIQVSDLHWRPVCVKGCGYPASVGHGV